MKWFFTGLKVEEYPVPFWHFIGLMMYCLFIGLAVVMFLWALFKPTIAKAEEMLLVRDGAVPVVVVVLTDRRLTQLRETNETVNGGIRPAMPPRDGLDIPDVKPLDAGAHGDCKDYVVTKAYALQKAFGWPPESLLFVIVRPNPMSPDMRHAILVARTDAGDYVLDNLSRDVTRWADSPYAGYAEHWFTTEFHERIFVPRSDGTFLRR